MSSLMEMANLTPKKTGLSVNIWSEHRGIQRNKPDKDGRVKIAYTDDYSVTVSIAPVPRILGTSSKLKKKIQGSSEWKAIKAGIDYVGRNFDLFQKHYSDLTDDFDDEDLFNALRARGEYK